MATLIQPDGELKEVQPRNGHDFTLEELRGFIGGGFIEIIHPAERPGCLLVIDEEGKLKGMRFNSAASLLYGNDGDVVVGPALLCREEEVE